MREICHFESDYAEPPARLVATRPLTITTRAGLLWVTLDERPVDHWLKPGETISLATGEGAWVSAGSDRTAWVLAAEAENAPAYLAVRATQLLRASWRTLSADGGRSDERASARLQVDDRTIM
ncbi:DUF2917 domain-containing protein [Paraburkholderia madseniana]|uniref:DUF2917 domain-containing protein n=1 Tax=Paraburkholderia madseniana TaxID=2599607 RepID=UPI0038BA3DFB